ncbi:MAG: DUF4344 domain-containing metallopeptidase [Rhodospirillales bacterium]|nr:DUF4344 domain-containing metallopeptidase [Rhodospirillales bacterium]
MLKPTIVALLFFMATPFQTQAGAYVADAMRLEVANEYIEAKAGQIAYVDLGSSASGSTYEVQARADNAVYNDISVFICSERDLQMLLAGRSNQCRGTNKEKGLVQFSVKTQHDGRHYLVINNSYSMMVEKKVNANVTLVAHMPEEIRSKFEQNLLQANAGIQRTFVVDDFDFRIEPCGMKNAFSKSATGDITMCSELMFDLLKKKMPGAIEGVMYHELGHTLLNLWGLPGWDNEETADEFALVMLYWAGAQEKAIDWIRYYAEHDSKAEAVHALKNGDRHPLSIQRIRNAQRILENPREVITRWNKLLYPHMTKEGLQGLLNTSPVYVDGALMDRYLKSAPAAKNQAVLASPPSQRSPQQSLWGPVN